jgi:DNA-binding SARP family transcriptional activator/streptogramin lyase
MEFKILGPLEIVGEDGPITLHRGKEQALLSFMLLHPNEVLPSDRLIDELWDERPPATAPKILQNAVSQLRKALGDGRLETRPPGYVFHLEPDELDLERFERLASEGRHDQALALWRGPPLIELREERFADDARRRLDEKRLGVLEDRIDGDLAAGRGAQLVPELEQLVAEHPLRERLHGQLMRALYASGRQADALEAYRRARRTFDEELGLIPGPELQELERKILQQDPALPRAGRPPRKGNRRRLLLIAVVVGLLVAGAIAAIFAATQGDASSLVATSNSLAVIDPDSNHVKNVLAIGGTPRGVTVGRRYVWAANAADGTVSQVDPKSLSVHTIGLGAAATDLVEDNGSVWVATGSDNTVVRIDARTGGVLEHIPLSRDPTASANAIAAGRNKIWGGSGGEIYKLDPASGALVARGNTHGSMNDVQVGGGSVWVANYEYVARVSEVTGRLTDLTNLGTIAAALAVGGGSVWAASTAPQGHGSVVWRLDPTNLRVTQTTFFGDDVAAGPPTLDLAFGEGALWVASYDDGTVVRINAASGNITNVIHVGGHPSGIAVGGGKVWVTVS